MVLWTACLLADPEDDVGLPVADVATEPKAARATAELAPVAKGVDGDADQVRGLVDGEHLVAEALAGARNG